MMKSVAAALMLLCGSATLALADVGKHEFRIAFQGGVDSGNGRVAAAFDRALREKSGGNMGLALFADGSLGGDTQTLSMVRGGTLDAVLTATPFMEKIIPQYTLLSLPYFYRSREEIRQVLDGSLGTVLRQQSVNNQLVALTIYGALPRQLIATRTVSSLSDLAGLKLRVQPDELSVATWSALKANPVAMAFPEVYPALEQRVVEAYEGPYDAIKAGLFHEVATKLTETEHVYMMSLIVFGKPLWDRLNDDERAMIEQVAVEVSPTLWEIANNADQESAELIRKTAEFVKLADGERGVFEAAAKPAIDAYLAGADQEAVKGLRTDLEKIRSPN